MMGVPIIFNRSDNAVSSYDWKDITQATGYINFYPMRVNIHASDTYILTCNSGITSGNTGLVSWAGNVGTDKDFDITFQKPSLIRGTALFSYYLDPAGAPNGGSVTINIYHVSTGAVETLLATCTASTIGDDNAWYCVSMPLTTKKFAIGEKLRLNFIAGAGASAGTITLTVNPTSAYASVLMMPFRIDI